MSYLDHVSTHHNRDLSHAEPFLVDKTAVGLIKPDFRNLLKAHSDVFHLSAGKVTLSPALTSFEERTLGVDAVLRVLAADGHIPGWRDEAYPVVESFSSPAYFDMERAAVPLFGIPGFGVHINGFVGHGSHMKMWIGRRSLSKPTGPGKLDQIVAGGQPTGMTLRQNVLKECAEEANIPPGLAATARPVSAVSYAFDRPEGIRRDVLFIYDLELPEDFKPHNTDGEIDEFYLWPMDRVMESIQQTQDFKFNCALVVIDFLIRHGFIEPDHPDYVDLITGLRVRT